MNKQCVVAGKYDLYRYLFAQIIPSSLRYSIGPLRWVPAHRINAGILTSRQGSGDLDLIPNTPASFFRRRLKTLDRAPSTLEARMKPTARSTCSDGSASATTKRKVWSYKDCKVLNIPVDSSLPDQQQLPRLPSLNFTPYTSPPPANKCHIRRLL